MAGYPRPSMDRIARSHSQFKYGIWEIYGEDDNPDLGGKHYEPHLATVQGYFRDVYPYAFNLKGFWTWGGGGRIKCQQEFEPNEKDLMWAKLKNTDSIKVIS